MDPTGSEPLQSGGASPAVPGGPAADVAKICDLLRAKDDTQRFVGLALLKSVLDNSPQLRQDDQAVQFLWQSLSSKFLDRLLLTGSNPSNKNAKEMLDLAVSVLHTFAALLPTQLRAEPKLTGRIPGLVDAVLHSSEETTKLVLQLLHTLASSPEGARALVGVQDLSPLTEIAPANALVLDILRFAWLNSMAGVEDKRALSHRIDETIQSLTSSFTGTDAITLLEFLASFLRQADSTILPTEPRWLKAISGYIQAIVTSRPSSEARSAYTNATASLLQAYPSTTPKLLFTDSKKEDKPFAYLLISLLLIDIRSSAPLLLEQLNTPGYSATSRRLASAFDIICIFIGHLVRSLEEESLEGLAMSPDSLLKIRKGISDTMSVTIEYLRDRWDASVAGAMGLHPDARVGNAETSTGSHRTLTWDSIANAANDDPFILSAVRALALWLREDENKLLRKEATGLVDMFMDLYRASTPEKLDFRSPVLVALEALVVLDQGRELFLRHDGWQILSKDLAEIFRNASAMSHEGEASRGTEIVRILLQVVEQESGGTTEEWMNLITTVAAWDLSPQERPPEVQEFQVAVLQLSCTLLARASGGMQGRYRHSIDAISGIATQLSRCIGRDSFVREAMEDVIDTLGGLEAHGS
ncbi:neurochondrin domain-containing protein [Hirsutella rhossiliensis]|uniref:Neurochondrin domain-containing protein n=1 Tax=Hirsutella rhossiliensis TaxID=111463 RepID=A0A9P8MSH2_9HYPO|nr:neurochondrin domain-containing protein [Hirsutella rhossiliensis]KAH0960602.1 neurochondrin domain-containing protein [Hirsutella rhossiliensis]